MRWVQSVESSNRIEGIHASSKRVRELAEQKTTPKTRNEKEIAAYRGAPGKVGRGLATGYVKVERHECSG